MRAMSLPAGEEDQEEEYEGQTGKNPATPIVPSTATSGSETIDVARVAVAAGQCLEYGHLEQ